MKPKKAIAFLIISFLTGIILAVGAYHIFYVDSIQEYEMELQVSDRGGLNVATDKVYFSKIPPGGMGERSLEIYGDEDKDLKVRFNVEGPLRKWVIISENDFILPKGTTKNITVKAYVPENATIGINYTSILRGTFLRTW